MPSPNCMFNIHDFGLSAESIENTVDEIYNDWDRDAPDYVVDAPAASESDVSEFFEHGSPHFRDETEDDSDSTAESVNSDVLLDDLELPLISEDSVLNAIHHLMTESPDSADEETNSVWEYSPVSPVYRPSSDTPASPDSLTDRGFAAPAPALALPASPPSYSPSSPPDFVPLSPVYYPLDVPNVTQELENGDWNGVETATIYTNFNASYDQMFSDKDNLEDRLEYLKRKAEAIDAEIAYLTEKKRRSQ